MALAYVDLAMALAAPDNESAQHDMQVEQAIILLVSGKRSMPQVDELQALLSGPTSFEHMYFGVFTDLEKGKPADALARVKKDRPKCFTTEGIENPADECPLELVRVYQELGKRDPARDLADEIVRDARDNFERMPEDSGNAAYYAAALACAGRTDEALDMLEDLVSSGWRGHFTEFLRFNLYVSVYLDAIRDDARFQAIAATVEADMAQQLENVRDMQRRGEVPTLEEVRALVASKQEG